VTDFPGDPFAAPAVSRPELIRNGRYYLPPLHDPTGKSTARTRVTNFVKTVSDTYVLNRWQQWQAFNGLARREDLYDELRATDLEDRDAVLRIIDQSMEAAKTDRVGYSTGNGGNVTGTALHAYTDQLDRGQPVTARSVWLPKLANYEKALIDADLVVKPGMIECYVVIEQFGVAGKFDRMLRHVTDGTLFIGDLKTQKAFYSWWEIGMQLALYAHADAIWDAEQCRYRDMPPVSQDVAVVAHMPMVHDGDDPDRVQLYPVNIAKGWKACQLVADVREGRKDAKNWVLPFTALRRSMNSVEGYATRLNTAESQDDLLKIRDGMLVDFGGTIPVELDQLGSKRWMELGS